MVMTGFAPLSTVKILETETADLNKYLQDTGKIDVPQTKIPLKPINNIAQPTQAPALQPVKPFELQKRVTLSDMMQEAGKVYSQANQGGYKQQLQPTFDYIQSQIPEISKQFMQKSFKQNVNPETGLGGQIAAKLLSDFQTNVLAPVLQQVGTQQALSAPKEQLQIAQNLQTQNNAEIDRKMADVQEGLRTGLFKEDVAQDMYSQILGVPKEMLTKPDVRIGVMDQYFKESREQGRAPSIEELNLGLQSLGYAPAKPEELSKYGEAAKPQSGLTPIKVSSLISKINTDRIAKNTAADYGIPYDKVDNWNWGINSPSWEFRDTPQTRQRIEELYNVNPSFRAWVDNNTGG